MRYERINGDSTSSGLTIVRKHEIKLKIMLANVWNV